MRLGRSSTGARPRMSGKDAAVALRCAGVLTARADRNWLSDRNHGRSRGAAGAPRGGEKGKRRGEREKQRHIPGMRSTPLCLVGGRGSAPGMRLPARVEGGGGGKVRGELQLGKGRGFGKELVLAAVPCSSCGRT